MKYLLTALSLICSLAHAGVENMVAQCEAVMRCDICRVERDATVYTSETKLIFLPSIGMRRILVTDYNFIRNAGGGKVGGRYLMCMRVEEAMKEPDSGRAVAARTLFDADWQRVAYCP